VDFAGFNYFTHYAEHFVPRFLVTSGVISLLLTIKQTFGLNFLKLTEFSFTYISSKPNQQVIMGRNLIGPQLWGDFGGTISMVSDILAEKGPEPGKFFGGNWKFFRNFKLL